MHPSTSLRRLRALALGLLLMVGLGASEPVSIELRVAQQPHPVHVERLGINLNYLVDGEQLRPQGGIPLAEGLRALGVRSLRYPGGNKSDSHLWSVPPYQRPAPRLAVTGEWDWPAMEPRWWDRAGDRFARRVLDTDDALALAAATEAELVMVVPYDEAYPEPGEEPGKYADGPTVECLIETAVAWARYCRERGHPVRYWEIGNETYFHRGITAERYTADLIRFAEALHAVDPDIRVGANGPDTPRGRGKGDQHSGTGVEWWPTVLAAAAPHIDYLSLHCYPCYAWRSFAAYEQREPEVLPQLRAMRRAIRQHAPEADHERIELLVTETNSADWLGHPEEGENWAHEGSIGHALVLFDMLARYLTHDDLVTVQVWNTRWVHHRERDQLWDALDEANRPSAIGQALALWQRARSHWLEVEQPATLRCIATVDPASGAATVFLVNRSVQPQRVTLTGSALRGATEVRVEAWSGDGPDDTAPVFAAPTASDPSGLLLPGAGMLIVEWAP